MKIVILLKLIFEVFIQSHLVHFSPPMTCIRPEFVGVDGGCSGVSVPSRDEED